MEFCCCFPNIYDENFFRNHLQYGGHIALVHRVYNVLYGYFPEKFKIVEMGVILYAGSCYIQVNTVCRMANVKFELRVKNIVFCNI